ncbi:PorP/SprF family type IX secretion system membrane protein [Algoriphagus resistens]|uniref:PorP/SprF family type IX secretion system membrane protein n=1 Tax=Algoriphagus resistens TaxID=1750590 RepID=UPI00071681A3|nr:PorP/SprF family type IX secretion system membrane protein [Algoriphagus resistens]
MKTIKYTDLILLLVLSCASILSYGQQTPLFAEYNFNPFLVNPAYTGMPLGPEIILSNHGYFNSIEGTPSSSSITFNSSLSNEKMGIGALLSHDKIGVTTNTNASIAYSYKIFFGAKNNKSYMRRPYWQLYNRKVFSFGMTAGLHHLKEDLLDLEIDNDPEFAKNIAATLPTIGVGFLYHSPGFYIGVSAPNLLTDQFSPHQELNLSNPIYGYLGYRFFSYRVEDIMIKPSLLIKYEDGAPAQIDTNLSFSFRNKLELGVGYRSTSSINFLVGIYAWNHLLLNYQHNTRFNNSILGNSHGLILSYFIDGFE